MMYIFNADGYSSGFLRELDTKCAHAYPIFYSRLS
jgi:hypothetical protein